MQYMWRDNNTGKQVEVKRPIKEIEIVPDKDESIEAGMDVHEYAEAEWERVPNGAPAFVGPKNKGYWAK